MKTTNNLPRKTASKTTTATEPSGRAIPVATTSRSSRAPAGANCTTTTSFGVASTPSHRSRHTTTRLSATTPGPSETESSSATTNRYFGLLKRLFREQQESATTKTESLPQTSPIEPYLHLCPEALRRYYQPLPGIVRVLIAGLATSKAFVSTKWKTTNLSAISFVLIRQIAAFLFKSVAYTLIAQMLLQDTLFVGKQPSRVTMKTLVQKHFLPTSLSKYNPITIDPIATPPPSSDASPTESNKQTEPFTLGVHYLQYDNQDSEDSDDASRTKTKRTFDAMYFQHGFGASSLSWLPVLPALAKQMNARVALGHDTVGFGFTDRPKDARWYRPRQAARIAEAILAKESPAKGDSQAAPVCLVGHSMGSRSTLRLATQLPAETPKLIVLSSPALGLIPPKAPKKPPSSKAAKLVSSFSTAIRKKVFLPAFQYVLRRIVGTNGSWRKGLEGAWGDPQTITEDSDVLRYSWPSIGYGWEEGILRFAGAQVLVSDDELDDDFRLLRKVLELPNTKVLIVLGSRDRVIPTKSVVRFVDQVTASAENNIDVPIVELDGLGHCAFEEDREVFCDAVEELVREHWDTMSY